MSSNCGKKRECRKARRFFTRCGRHHFLSHSFGGNLVMWSHLLGGRMGNIYVESSLVHWAIITKSHRMGNYKQKKFISHNSRK